MRAAQTIDVATPARRLRQRPVPAHAREALATIREDARRERLLDMEGRVRRYRGACFVLLAAALGATSPEIGWWWAVPLGFGFCGFAVANRFMRTSRRPALWLGAAWGILPLLLAGAVVATGGAPSPALMWFALPAVTLGVRFEPRGIALGAVYILGLLLASALVVDPSPDPEARQLLIAAVTLVLSTVILSGALIESERAHRRRSTLDPLTGLFNRTALEQRLGDLSGESCDRDEGLSHALLLCDLDHFKRINDQLGHGVGDAVLQDIAYVMRATLRAGDSVYRIGGEEILVLLPGANAADATEIAERLRVAVRERHPVGVTVTISIGVAVCEEGRLDPDELIDQADAALYRAKAEGRDAVCLA